MKVDLAYLKKIGVKEELCDKCQEVYPLDEMASYEGRRVSNIAFIGRGICKTCQSIK